MRAFVFFHCELSPGLVAVQRHEAIPVHCLPISVEDNNESQLFNSSI